MILLNTKKLEYSVFRADRFEKFMHSFTCDTCKFVHSTCVISAWVTFMQHPTITMITYYTFCKPSRFYQLLGKTMGDLDLDRKIIYIYIHIRLWQISRLECDSFLFTRESEQDDFQGWRENQIRGKLDATRDKANDNDRS